MKRRMPSPSMIVACVALAVALGGTSYAAVQLSKNSVGSKELKKGAVKGQDLAPNSVTSPKVKDRSLKAVDFVTGELPAGPAGPQGPPGAPNPSADTLDGIDSKGFAQVIAVTDLNYFEQSPLIIEVGGYGAFRLRCVANEVSLGIVKDEGLNGIASGTVTKNEGTTRGFFDVTDTPENLVFEGDKGAQISGTYRHTELGGSRTVLVEFGARDNPDESCAGHLIARTSG